MKFTRIIFASFLICFVFTFAFAQDKSSKEKDKKSKQKPIEIKANVAVLNAAGNLVDNIKAEDLKIFEDNIEQKITRFAKKAPVLNLALVVDNSGSMREKLDEATAAASSFIDNLQADDEAFVVRFVDSDTVEITQEWTSNKKELKEALGNMFVEGGQSAVLDAIYLSAEKILERSKNDGSKRYAIVLISDAEERDSYYNFDQTISLFRETELQLFLVSYAENAPKKKKKAKSLSNLLALETGGTVYSLPKKHSRADVINALKNIAGELRSNYVVGYTPTNQKRDGLPRKLRVEVADGAGAAKRQGVVREGFVVPEE